MIASAMEAFPDRSLLLFWIGGGIVLLAAVIGLWVYLLPEGPPSSSGGRGGLSAGGSHGGDGGDGPVGGRGGKGGAVHQLPGGGWYIEGGDGGQGGAPPAPDTTKNGSHT